MISTGLFGRFGGVYAPETLLPALEQLEVCFNRLSVDPFFLQEFDQLLKNYAGRPTPLYHAANLSRLVGADIFLKREDLLHGGAHKTNNALGQGLLAKAMGKRRLIAETGAGQHGVATAMVGALLGMETEIFMGELDIERQHPNVIRMQLLGARVHSVSTGGRALKDAINSALREWISSVRDTHYLLGTAAGPHPYPTMVKFFQKVIGEEARAQFKQGYGGLPDAVVACVGGGSNAIGMFNAFVTDGDVRLIGVEPAGKGLDSNAHGAVLQKGTIGCLHGMISKVMQTADGQILDAHSISAGLDYPSVGPEHAYLQESGLASYVGATDAEAIFAYKELARLEGIIPALESSHALAYAMQIARRKPGCRILVNLSGRGDKDLEQVMKYVG